MKCWPVEIDERSRSAGTGQKAQGSSCPIAMLWRIFWVVAVLQGIDLITTYAVLVSGGREGNVFMRRVILTPFAPFLKISALVFFAALIAASARFGRPSARRLSIAGYAVLIFYVLIDINNTVVLFKQR
jgi:Domain of unknown function (DUF5658)